MGACMDGWIDGGVDGGCVWIDVHMWIKLSTYFVVLLVEDMQGES